jgi:AraC-like DNA-binding protein
MRIDLVCDERPSDSPYVETIWRSHTEQAGSFISMAESRYGLVVTKFRGSMFITVRGPATRAALAYTPADAEFFGIQFRSGVYLQDLPAQLVAQRHDLSLPEAASTSFWLNGSVWQYPDYDNADVFVDRLLRSGLLVCDPVVAAVSQGQTVDTSVRTVRRRFLRATGLPFGSLYQIGRAHYATTLLKQGVSILDTVNKAGYFDQPHLTRSLKQYVGLTPAQITDEHRSQPLSFLYKTQPFRDAKMQMLE